MQGYISSSNGCGSGAAICLKYITIYKQGSLPQRRQVSYRSQRATNEALYFLIPAGNPTQ
jgi:hypothetical protein